MSDALLLVSSLYLRRSSYASLLLVWQYGYSANQVHFIPFTFTFDPHCFGRSVFQSSPPPS
jgi:hypothetical protein